MLPKVVTALENCMEWMENLRASGDAGWWEWADWEEGEFIKAQEVLDELHKLENSTS